MVVKWLHLCRIYDKYVYDKKTDDLFSSTQITITSENLSDFKLSSNLRLIYKGTILRDAQFKHIRNNKRLSASKRTITTRLTVFIKIQSFLSHLVSSRLA